MGCRWCKIVTGAVIIVALTAIVASIVSSGGGVLPSWISFVSWVGGKIGIEGAAALKTFGYRLFTFLMSLGATLVFVLADVIDWILCKFCQLLRQCTDEECPPPHLNPKP